MTMPMVFDDFTRTEVGPSPRSMSNFALLNRSAREEAYRARGVIQEWTECYPRTHREGLVKRFRSDDNLTHQSAFFELIIHEMLRAYSLQIEIEPEVLNGKRPDFRVKLQSGESIYVEATIVSESIENTGPKGAMNHLLDIIDKIVSNDFFVDVEVEQPLSGYPSAQDVKHPIERWHRTLAYEDVTAAWKHGDTSKHEFRLKVGGGEIVLRPIPKMRRGFPGRFIGSDPSTSGWLDTSSKIRKDLIKKGNKYKELDSPLLLAINVISLFPERNDMINALFGSEAVEVSVFNDDSREARHVRQKDGVWTSTRYRRISGVLWANNLVPWNVGRKAIELVSNPWADRPLPNLGIQLPMLKPVAGELSFVDGLPLTELLNLPPNWPME